jgi:hypothetical protein
MVGLKSNWYVACLIGAIALSGCSRKEVPELMNLRSPGNGPDEFGVIPNHPLEIPKDLAALPEPNTAGGNKADLRPKESAITALGGNKNSISSTKITSSEQVLLNSAGRFGVDPKIRATLKTEDEDFRKGNYAKPLERLANVNVYNRVYSNFALNAYLELQRLRRLGVSTPSAPPADQN